MWAPGVRHKKAGASTRRAFAAALPGLTRLSHRQGVAVLEYSPGATGMAALLQSLAQIPGIQDVQIEKAPMEDVIATLYRELMAQK
ncbi:MAG: hypothetical protein ACK5L3_11185 [Oscillospiraceae bacterium]